VRNENQLPDKFYLAQNYPNPFNPATTIKYSVPSVKEKKSVETQNFASVQLKIYDVLGREVATLVNKQQAPGNYQVTFSAINLPSGIYLYSLKVGNFSITKKMLLLK